MPGRKRRGAHIAVVGAGNLASALAPALAAAGYEVDLVAVSGRSLSGRGRRLARELGASLLRAGQSQANVFWLCVPDAAIANAAKSLPEEVAWEGKVAFHSSGALSSDDLQALRAGGAAVASVHPLMTFVRGSRPGLAEVPFGVEGDPKAVRWARSIVRDLGGIPFAVSRHKKAAYHAWGMFLSPLLTALLAASEIVAAEAGISRMAGRKKMLPILRQTLTNYSRLGAAGSFSGPIARGDVDTVASHLRVLRQIPGARAVYAALAKIALRELPAKNRAALRRMLEE